jgi:alcohol dehydrogenase
VAKDNFVFCCPTVIVCRAGAVADTAIYIQNNGLKKPLIVTDKGIVAAGVVKQVEDVLKAAGIAYAIYDEVVANPLVETCNKGIEAYKAGNCDSIISVGGGSSIDTGKAIGCVIKNGGIVEDYDFIKKKKGFPPKNPPPFHICIPTTAGTGSEVTPFAVITDPVEKYKMAVAGPVLIPNVGILDPNLTIPLPPAITAATGMDALTHCIECYITRNDNPVIDMWAKEGIVLISKWLRQAVANGGNTEARFNVLLGSMMGGVAFGNGGLGLTHSMAHQLGFHFNVPHGIANAMILPTVMKYNIISNPERYRVIAELMGIDTSCMNTMEAADAAVDAVQRLSDDVGIGKLCDLGVSKDSIPVLSETAYQDFQTGNNPRITPADLSDIKKLFELAWG